MTGRPQADANQPSSQGSLMPRLLDVRIRSKLGMILIIPLIAVLALAAVRLVDSGQRALAAEEVRSLTALSVEASRVSNQLHLERIEATKWLAEPGSESGEFSARTEQSDEAMQGYLSTRSALGEPPEIVNDLLNKIDGDLAEVEAIRQQILGDAPITASASVVRYGVILSDILAFQEAVAEVTDDPALSEEIRAVAAMSKAKALAAEAEAVIQIALSDEELTDEEHAAFLVTQTGQQEAFLAFEQTANLDQQAIASEAITGGNVNFAELATRTLLASAGGQVEDSPEALRTAFNGMVVATRWVEEQMQADLLASATVLRDDVFQQVLMESVAVLLALIVAVTLAVLLARMLARSLSRLRQHALRVADRELPETVARLADPRTLGENTPAQLAAQVREPVALRSRDEIGQVAQAFTVVHRAAVRVAAEQAALRTSVSAMFLNLARRSQSLVDRMISQLDEIERHEEDPKRLARMFTLDHLATRMRRNDENLLTLAGADSSAPRSDDALVVDVLRAAQSEVEHYDRIEFGTVDTDVSVVAGAVNDVVRLVAELFDNATRFSPPDAPVVCEARRLGDQVILQIEDRGVGMSQDQVDRVNAWLATPPAVEVTTFRKMGLAVVARLASRHGIRVELRCDPNLGTVAYVALPRPVLILPPSRLRFAEIAGPRSPMPAELAPVASPAPAVGPLPARHLGQLPRRSPAVVHHAANRRGQSSRETNARTSANNVDAPVAGRPVYELTANAAGGGSPAAAPVSAPATAVPDATVELPIFKEMEAVWFRSHGSIDLGHAPDTPRAGGYPVPASHASPPPPPTAPAPPEPSTAPPPGQRGYDGAGYNGGYDPSPTEPWQTAADSGWQAAAAAAQPQTGGATTSGLPKRVPQAQLVPGSVEVPTSSPNQRRSPEEVRGLLAAYHRGVQRGRESGGGR